MTNFSIDSILSPSFGLNNVNTKNIIKQEIKTEVNLNTSYHSENDYSSSRSDTSSPDYGRASSTSPDYALFAANQNRFSAEQQNRFLQQQSSRELPNIVCIGAEGGWIDYEIELLSAQGCTPVHIGSRILRTEAAVNAILGQWLL